MLYKGAGDSVLDLLCPCYFDGWDCHSFRTVQRRVGEEEKQNWLWDKGKNRSPAKAFEVLDDPSACSSLRLNPFLKCIKCLSVKFGPDSICDSLWRHPHRSFSAAVWIHKRGVWSKGLTGMGPCGVEVDRSFQQGPVKHQQPGPIKSEWEEHKAFNSNLTPCCQCCQASHYPQSQKIRGKGAGQSRLPHDFINPGCDGIFMDSIGSKFFT